jgi:hypothetical protein
LYIVFLMCFRILPFMVTWTSYECALLVLMFKWVVLREIGSFVVLVLLYNVEYYASMHVGIVLFCFLLACPKKLKMCYDYVLEL